MKKGRCETGPFNSAINAQAGDEIERHLLAIFNTLHRTLHRGQKLGRIFDTLTITTAGLGDLFKVRRGREINHWQAILLGGIAFRIHRNSSTTHREPLRIVEDHSECWQLLGTRNIIGGQRNTEHVRAITHGAEDLTLGRCEFCTKRLAKPHAERTR